VIETNPYRWSAVSVVGAVVVSILSTAVFLLLEFRGYHFTDIPAFETVTSALAGGMVLCWRHPRTWWFVLLFYVPVMAVLLVAGVVIIAAQFGYRFET
jgi:hypothetical protein